MFSYLDNKRRMKCDVNKISQSRYINPRCLKKNWCQTLDSIKTRKILNGSAKTNKNQTTKHNRLFVFQKKYE